MGRVKEHIMLMEQLEEHGAKIEFQCPTVGCDAWIECYSEIPYPNLQAENQSDITQTESFEVQCDGCKCSFEGGLTHDGAFFSAELVDFPDTVTEIETLENFNWNDDYNDWLDYLSDDPFAVFHETYTDLENFVQKNCHDFLNTIENRMALTQAWSMFETYLADQLALYLENDSQAIIRFARGDAAIKDIKFDAAVMLANGQTIKNEIIRNVKGRLFHNFGTSGTEGKMSKGVQKWYQIGLQINIVPDLKKLDQLRSFAVARHDCVHRNGKDKEGELRSDVTKSYVLDALNSMLEIASYIQKKCDPNHPDLK